MGLSWVVSPLVMQSVEQRKGGRIAVSDIDTLSCPKCGGCDYNRIDSNKILCNYCGTISIVSEDKSTLKADGWKCPSCGFINSINSKFCGKCGNRITKTCPKCGKDVEHHLRHCTNCGYEYMQGEHTVYDCIGGIGTVLFPYKITLTNKRICFQSMNNLCAGYFEILLSNVKGIKLKKDTVVKLKNKAGIRNIKVVFNEPSKLGQHLKKLV